MAVRAMRIAPKSDASARLVSLEHAANGVSEVSFLSTVRTRMHFRFGLLGNNMRQRRYLPANGSDYGRVSVCGWIHRANLRTAYGVVSSRGENGPSSLR